MNIFVGDSVSDTNVVGQEPGTLWIHSVPQAVVDSVSDQEKKRQEAINEVIYTERDFVRDMEYLRDVRSPQVRISMCIDHLSPALDQTTEYLRDHPRTTTDRIPTTGLLEHL